MAAGGRPPAATARIITQHAAGYTGVEGAIEGVAVVAADANACSACTVLADRVYVPRKLPRVPIEGCTGRGGCRCRYEPAVTVVE
jgi:hypothetical protein